MKKTRKQYKKKIVSFTHEDLGIPQSLEIAGRTIEIELQTDCLEQRTDPDTKLRQFKGYFAKFAPKDSKIYLFVGNKDIPMSKEYVLISLFEEIQHFVFHISGNIDLQKNEQITKSTAELWYQIHKQL